MPIFFVYLTPFKNIAAKDTHIPLFPLCLKKELAVNSILRVGCSPYHTDILPTNTPSCACEGLPIDIRESLLS